MDTKIYNYTYGNWQFQKSINFIKIIKDLRNLEESFDFSNSNKDQELFSNENKKVLSNFKIETPKSILIDEFICLRSKAYSITCGSDIRNKLKGISKSQSKDKKNWYYLQLSVCRRLSKRM